MTAHRHRRHAVGPDIWRIGLPAAGDDKVKAANVAGELVETAWTKPGTGRGITASADRKMPDDTGGARR